MDNFSATTGTPQESTDEKGCRFCAASPLRRSRLRPEDWARLLLLQWPVRCLRCHKRQYVLWTDARKAIPSTAPHAPELAALDSWKNFTAAEPPTLRTNQSNEGDR